MTEETAVAASSAATEAPKFTQYDSWDEEGNPTLSRPPKASPKKEAAESAPADKPKAATSEDAADSAAKKPQEKPSKRRPDIEERFRQYTDRIDTLERELAEAKKPKETKADSSPARPVQPQYTRPKPTVEAKDDKGNPKYASYEDYVEDLADWKAEQRIAAAQREQRQAQELQTLSGKLEEARARYENYDSVAKPVLTELFKPNAAPQQVLNKLGRSPVMADILYVIGGTEASKNDFIAACKDNPDKALDMVYLLEQEVMAELKKARTKPASEEHRDDTPASPKPRAPKPPSEVGGRGAVAEDTLISAAKAGDFRSFDAEQTRRALASRR